MTFSLAIYKLCFMVKEDVDLMADNRFPSFGELHTHVKMHVEVR